jgi:hypothetical protein
VEGVVTCVRCVDASEGSVMVGPHTSKGREERKRRWGAGVALVSKSRAQRVVACVAVGVVGGVQGAERSLVAGVWRMEIGFFGGACSKGQ